MDDGYTFEFTMSVNGFLKNKATADSAGKPATNDGAATPDSGKPSSTNSNAVKQSSGAVKTGEPMGAIILAAAVLITSAFIALYNRKRKVKV